MPETNREILQHPPYIDRAFPPPASTNMSPSIAPSNDDQPAQPPGHQLASNDTSSWVGQLETFSLDHQMRLTSITGEGSPQRRYQTPCPDACHCHNPAREKTDILRETHAPTLQCPFRITVTTPQLLHLYDRGRAQHPEVLMLSNSKLRTKHPSHHCQPCSRTLAHDEHGNAPLPTLQARGGRGIHHELADSEQIVESQLPHPPRWAAISRTRRTAHTLSERPTNGDRLAGQRQSAPRWDQVAPWDWA